MAWNDALEGVDIQDAAFLNQYTNAINERGAYVGNHPDFQVSTVAAGNDIQLASLYAEWQQTLENIVAGGHWITVDSFDGQANIPAKIANVTAILGANWTRTFPGGSATGRMAVNDYIRKYIFEEMRTVINALEQIVVDLASEEAEAVIQSTGQDFSSADDAFDAIEALTPTADTYTGTSFYSIIKTGSTWGAQYRLSRFRQKAVGMAAILNRTVKYYTKHGQGASEEYGDHGLTITKDVYDEHTVRALGAAADDPAFTDWFGSIDPADLDRPTPPGSDGTVTRGWAMGDSAQLLIPAFTQSA